MAIPDRLGSVALGLHEDERAGLNPDSSVGYCSHTTMQTYCLRHSIRLEETPSHKGYLFDPQSGYIFLLSPTGLAISRLMQERSSSLGEIVNWVDANMEIADLAATQQDIEAFLARLAEYGLLAGV